MTRPYAAIYLAVVLALPLRAAADEASAWEALQSEAAKLTDGLPEGEDASGKKLLAERLREQGKHFREFLQEFPASPERWEARMALMQVGNSLDMLEEREPDMNAQSVELQSIADDKNAPENIRADAGLVLLQIASVKFDKERGEEAARALGAAVEKFLETHPDDARAPMLHLTQAQALEAFDQERARAIYEETAKNENKEISEAAKNGLALMEMRAKPFELSFTAVDGRKVDLADLRGKVVLVDFWATWCPPCMEEAPSLVETYEKFKDRGLEIVGISLDSDKDALKKFAAENKMTWPQFFDGKGWDNEIAKRFNIKSVPTVWLLDRDGKLTDPSPRTRLAQAIEAALAKP
ncbi:MAG: TlpA disulfide reductase family protein [Chthoniobacterales bacterium]|jgi:thiol-disulfide isomerase/thioredoxin